uniref:Uncharacterized protein n=1 Tax=Octopus bimaculoides TaxID=37653 RepID=A0A0L8HGG3_OCTBM
MHGRNPVGKHGCEQQLRPCAVLPPLLLLLPPSSPSTAAARFPLSLQLLQQLLLLPRPLKTSFVKCGGGQGIKQSKSMMT